MLASLLTFEIHNRDVDEVKTCWIAMLIRSAVIVRRVIEARRLHALPSSQKPPKVHYLEPEVALSKTQPMTPLSEEKSRLDNEDVTGRPNGKLPKGWVWTRLKCW